MFPRYFLTPLLVRSGERSVLPDIYLRFERQYYEDLKKSKVRITRSLQPNRHISSDRHFNNRHIYNTLDALPSHINKGVDEKIMAPETMHFESRKRGINEIMGKARKNGGNMELFQTGKTDSSKIYLREGNTYDNANIPLLTDSNLSSIFLQDRDILRKNEENWPSRHFS